MLLAIDAGNTNVVFAVFEGQELRGRWRISTDPGRTCDEYGMWLRSRAQLARPGTPLFQAAVELCKG